MVSRLRTSSSRRDFLASSAAFIGAANYTDFSTGSCQAAQPPKGFPGFSGIELAIATICTDGFANHHHEPAFANIPGIGFKNVEFNLWYPDLLTPAYFKGLRERCATSDLQPVSLQGSGFGHSGREGGIKDIAHKLLLIEGCRQLGCRIIKCTGARREQEGGIEAIVTTCREIAPVAEELGVLITLENHANNVLERPEDYNRVFTEIDSPNVGMCLDTGHFEGVGVDVLDVIQQFGPRILQVDLKDCRERGKGHNTVAFGEGVTDFDSILDVLLTSGFTGYLVIEQAWAEPLGDWKSDLRRAYERFRKWERPFTTP